jgi:amino acid adenylation domain-containing protein
MPDPDFESTTIERMDWTEADLETSVPMRFERVAERFPDRVAVEAKTGSLTYKGLVDAAGRVTSAISESRTAGSGPIVILMPRSSAFFSAFLGVLGSANVCVPLDPETPTERLRSLIGQTQPKLVLSDTVHFSLARQVCGDSTTILDSTLFENSTSSGHQPTDIQPSAPAVIYFTSGSSGEPKGIVRQHRNMLHHAFTYSLDQAITPDDRQSFLFSPQFGASMPDMLGALLNGACLVPFDVRAETPAGVADWIEYSQVSLLHIPVPLFRLVFSSMEDGRQFDALRAILLGGEAVSARDLRSAWLHVSERCVIVHQLSSSEANYISRATFTRRSTPDEGVLHVGRPARGKEVLILDDALSPVPQGNAGQIAVRSRYLAAGYWHDPERSAEAFLTEFDDPAESMYLTGDLGLIQPDGNLRHLGRRDRQIRVSGYRVEPAEVEAQLLTLPSVRQAAVVSTAGPSASPRLIAYLAPSDPTEKPTLETLRRELRDSLPNSMLPSRLVWLDQLPLLSSGKVDRTSLPPSTGERPTLESHFEAPRDGVEEQLTSIWESVLGVRPIGVRDSFFALGGDSLMAMALLARVSQTFGRDIPQSSLLQAETVEDQAELIRTPAIDRRHARIVAIQPHGELPAFFCISPSAVDVLAYRDLAQRLGPDRPFYALFAADHDPSPPDISQIEYEAAAHLSDLLPIQPEGPYLLGGYSNGGIVALEMAQQLTAAGQGVDLVVLLDCYGPGYRKLLPYLRPWMYRPLQALRGAQRRVDDLLPWARMHLDTLVQLSWPGRFHYISRKVGPRWQRTRIRWGNRIRRLPNRHRRPGRRAGPTFGRSYTDYRPKAYAGRVALFRASRQPLGIESDPLLGWGEVLTGDVEVYEVPGHHDSILFPPRIHLLAARLGAVMPAKAVSDPSTRS